MHDFVAHEAEPRVDGGEKTGPVPVASESEEIPGSGKDRIAVGAKTDSDELQVAVEENADYIKRETLAVSLVFEPLLDVKPVDVEIAGHALKLYVRIESA